MQTDPVPPREPTAAEVYAAARMIAAKAPSVNAARAARKIAVERTAQKIERRMKGIAGV